MVFAAAAAKSRQSCPTLCDPLDSSPPGSPVLGILQARTLKWVAISFSNAWKLKVKVKWLSHVRLLATPWTAAHQAPTSMGFSRLEHWRGETLPSSRVVEETVFNICLNNLGSEMVFATWLRKVIGNFRAWKPKNSWKASFYFLLWRRNEFQRLNKFESFQFWGRIGNILHLEMWGVVSKSLGIPGGVRAC